MLTTSEKLLCEVYNFLSNKGATQEAEKIKQVIRIETRTHNSNFSWFDYVAKDKLRPVMSFVWRKDGYKVASDGHILLATKDDYSEDMENKGENVQGEIITDEVYGLYPRWQNAVPTHNEKECKAFTFNEQLFDDKIKDFRAEYKAAKGKGTRWNVNWLVKCGDTYFKAENFDKFIKALKQYNRSRFYIKGNCRPAYVNDDDFKLLIMPVLSPDEDKMDLCRIIDMSDCELNK